MRKIGVLVAAVSLLTLSAVGLSFGAVESEQGGQVPPDMSQDASSTPKEYAIPPVNPKSLKPSKDHPFMNKSVKNLKGETLGTIHHMMVDTDKGKDIYAILYLEGKKDQYVPVPLNYLKEGKAGLVLNASKAQLEKGPNFGGKGASQDFEHQGGEPLKPNLR